MSLVLELHEAATHLPDRTVASASRPVSNPAFLYCLFVVILPLLAIPAFIGLGKSDFFLHHGASIWVQSNDAVFNMQDRNCDVLVFGDSTAMTGIDPDAVNRTTGLRTCNIAVTNAVLAVTGNLTLDRYLQKNAKPKVLVVQLSPDDFQQENRVWKHTIYAEGLLELLRHGPPEEARHVLLTHPHEAVAFAGYAAGFSAYYAIKDVWFRTTHLRPEEDQVRMRAGSNFFTPPAAPREYCDSTQNVVDHQGGSFARALAEDYRTTYGGSSSVVLVDVAPIPTCDNNLKEYSAQLRGITSNTLEDLPISAFNDERHYTAKGSQMVSWLVAQQINQVALQNPAIYDRISEPQPVSAALHSVALRR